MKEREELELILNLIRKYNLPLSPILEYAIKEKMEEFPESYSVANEEETVAGNITNEENVEQSIHLPLYHNEQQSSIRDYSIENQGNYCYIINSKGERVFTSSGKLKIIGEEFYKIRYDDTFVSMNLVKKDDRGVFVVSKRVFLAQKHSPLCAVFNKTWYLNQIKAVRFDSKTKEYHVQVENRWYGSSGYYADLEQIEKPIQGKKISSEYVDDDSSKDDYTIENSFLRCSILNKKGERVFSTDGKLIKLLGKIYRFKLKSECFSLKDMKFEDGIWMIGEKKIVAYPQSELYEKIYNTEDYACDIEDIIDKPSFENCKLKVNGVWYCYNGNPMVSQNGLNETVDNTINVTEDISLQFSVKIGDTLKLFPSQVIGKVIKLRIDKTGHRKIVVQSETGSTAEVYDSKYLYQKIYDKKKDPSTSNLQKRERIKRESILEIRSEDERQTVKNYSSNIAKVGDWIKTNFYNERCQVVDIENLGSSVEKLIVRFKDGSQDWIMNNPEIYSIVDSSSNQIVKKKESISDILHHQQVTRRARIGDWIIRKSDGLIAKVVDIKGLGGGFERLILELEDGSQSGIFNNPYLFKVLQ